MFCFGKFNNSPALTLVNPLAVQYHPLQIIYFLFQLYFQGHYLTLEPATQTLYPRYIIIKNTKLSMMYNSINESWMPWFN